VHRLVEVGRAGRVDGDEGDVGEVAPPLRSQGGVRVVRDLRRLGEDGQEQTGANNIVTSIVFDFRGFDTLGEATVLFTAVLGVGMMFRKMKEGEEYEND